MAPEIRGVSGRSNLDVMQLGNDIGGLAGWTRCMDECPGTEVVEP